MLECHILKYNKTTDYLFDIWEELHWPSVHFKKDNDIEYSRDKVVMSLSNVT